MLLRTAGLPLQWPGWTKDEVDMLTATYRDVSISLQLAFSAAKTAFESEKDHMFADNRLQKITTNLRRQLRKNTGKVVVPVDPYLKDKRPELAGLVEGLNKAIAYKQAVLAHLEEKYKARLTEEKKRLTLYARNETICRSLLFSSHSLLHELPEFARSIPENWHKKDRRTAAALLKYLFRSATKTTPLSRLATVSLQYLDRAPDDTDEWARVFSSAKCVVTPNVALLPALYDLLLVDPAFYNTLGLRLNPSLQTGPVTYEWLYFNGQEEGFQQLDVSVLLEKVRAFFQEAKKTVRCCDLRVMLADHTGRSEQDIQSFVFQLIDYGWLEWIFPEQGLAPGWCGGLYNYLGFLPASALLTEAAYLLQWLRTAARTMPFQSLAEAQETQLEALVQCRAFFERHGAVCPDIPAEHIFYEDVESPVQSNLPVEIVHKLTAQIDDAIKNAAPYRVSGLRAALTQFGFELLAEGESIPFLTFCKLFLEQEDRNTAVEILENQIHLEKIGALLQFYTTESGEYRAVLNGLFPGGGKMTARWLHLFPVDVRDHLRHWWPEETLSFPWQNWSNVNFQPHFASETLSVPGGRAGSDQSIALSEILVFRSAKGLQLGEKDRGRKIVFSDLGLEDPHSKPPVVQILWQLGVPYISTGIFTDRAEWFALQHGVQHRKRVEYQSLVLTRAAWRVPSNAWEPHLADSESEGFELFILVGNLLTEWGVPRYFFAGFPNDTTRFFDRNSPLLMQEFCRMTQHKGNEGLYLSEMLPTPDQWLAEADGKRHAAEWALEFRREK
ncbi:MAG: lantibiotic dehydratase [Saprospiraceae bacterium]|nr:lantibiotic dehydratase [Saprospiraceae bacterium]